MSYKIRYGYDRYRHRSLQQALWLQCFGSCVLLIATGLTRHFCGDSWSLDTLCATQPGTVAEQAVFALSDALARGEGWYQALAVWCRTVIDAGAV